MTINSASSPRHLREDLAALKISSDEIGHTHWNLHNACKSLIQPLNKNELFELEQQLGVIRSGTIGAPEQEHHKTSLIFELRYKIAKVYEEQNDPISALALVASVLNDFFCNQGKNSDSSAKALANEEPTSFNALWNHLHTSTKESLKETITAAREKEQRRKHHEFHLSKQNVADYPRIEEQTDIIKDCLEMSARLLSKVAIGRSYQDLPSRITVLTQELPLTEAAKRSEGVRIENYLKDSNDRIEKAIANLPLDCEISQALAKSKFYRRAIRELRADNVSKELNLEIPHVYKEKLAQLQKEHGKKSLEQTMEALRKIYTPLEGKLPYSKKIVEYLTTAFSQISYLAQTDNFNTAPLENFISNPEVLEALSASSLSVHNLAFQHLTVFTGVQRKEEDDPWSEEAQDLIHDLTPQLSEERIKELNMILKPFNRRRSHTINSDSETGTPENKSRASSSSPERDLL